MHGRKAEFGRGRRLVGGALVLAALLFLAAPAAGQEQPNPFSFLKPWVEKEILGRGSSTEPPPAETPGEPTGALPDAAPSEAAPSPAAIEPPSDAASAEEGAPPLVGPDESSALRGSAGQPADALSESEFRARRAIGRGRGGGARIGAGYSACGRGKARAAPLRAPSRSERRGDHGADRPDCRRSREAA